MSGTFVAVAVSFALIGFVLMWRHILRLGKERNRLYDALRLAEDCGEEMGEFDAEERWTGPEGWDTKNEERWVRANEKELGGA